MFKPSVLACLVAITLLPLSGCDQKNTAATTPATSPSMPAATAPQAYTPLSADQLYQLVSPIALFPDKLLAQVLASAEYPDQISAANNWLAQHPGLQPAALSNAADAQPWDNSVRSLVLFPDIIDQMAKNIPWTTQLGNAYLNDPTDVMNAIQVMRQRAAHKGTLKNTQQQRVVVSAVPPDYVAPQSLVMAPPQTIVIEPSQPDVLYVPYYNPWEAYGEPVPVYPGYHYAAPAGYSGGEMLATGIIGFGAGIALGALINDHHHGWNDWDVHWGRHDNGRYQPVMYNNHPYVPHNTTVVNVNEYNNVNRYNTVNHYDSHNRYNSPVQVNNGQLPHFATPVMAHPSSNGTPLSAPHFGSAATMPHAKVPMTAPNFHVTPVVHQPVSVSRPNTQPLPPSYHPHALVNNPIKQPVAPEKQTVFHAPPVEHSVIAPPVHPRVPAPQLHQPQAPVLAHHTDPIKRPPEHPPVRKGEHKVG